MRKLMLLSLALISFNAFAEAPSVKITSYVYINQERKVAELCGVVSNATTTPTFVQITVDETSKRPATYNTWAGADGKFCSVVVSYYGTAIAKAQ
ncbi:hypothetical protein DOM21_04765 [Bacteriovorax stolpii]|uniref:Uncharacterized protein n=1 Tax=Bacteriovorax stolpii TaxID=960 RepID=A0A2K9NUP7_BACTC|nr:hypothetical protein [Bacteriovorax stolpii]AUN99241.1 hypothetical protein C0V70_14235 [Bacteriovorax stolpii]QDK40778.1 hypothetical protein DOM21_04765 [Bacteriovorax stolpii]TDP55219.1 hypothetical protein C8D79_0264 [Bacteriovorax stolpii]